MSFAEDVKNELCRYENMSSQSELIEVSCLLRVRGSLLLGMKGAVGMRISTANNAVARRVFNILKKNFQLPTSVMVRKGLQLRKKNMYTLTVEPSEEGRQVMEELYLWPPTEMVPTLSLRDLEAKRAFLRGVFLGGGSVNKPQSYYHLEFVTTNIVFAHKIVSLLKQFGIKAKITERKEELVVYVKDGDGVTSCLRIMGASQALLAFEEVRVMKEMRNQVNRQVNCETANLQKTVDAAIRQMEAIRRIEEHMELSDLPPKLQEVALIRLDHPTASLQELETLMDGRISKSGINHRLKKLQHIADNL